MCCESCPEYEECAVKAQLKSQCCEKCPDYDTCFRDEDEEVEEQKEWDD